MTGASVPILMYHSVSDQMTPGYRRWTVTPARFEQHLAALCAEGWQTVTFGRAAAALRDGTALPDKTVVVTVDDGLADFHTAAMPLLQAYGATATLFVPTAYIGGSARWLPGEDTHRSMLSWSQLREAAATGIEVASHGHRHCPVDVGPQHRMLDEFRRSRALLEDGLGLGVRSLAYPFGYHRAVTRRMAGAAGYDAACAVIGLPASRSHDVRALPRIAVTQDMDGSAVVAAIGRRYGGAERWAGRTKQALWELGRTAGLVGPQKGPRPDAANTSEVLA
ncbi:polysaccharide deacetylase family protein [Dactylosporangium sp. CA-092794]|uniref:polysaccharide deacetylase family protein n=1 Tax=Dactylosporangium sp. CA-092794 TaxID=3239929 RepID=UPI003D8B20DB